MVVPLKVEGFFALNFGVPFLVVCFCLVVFYVMLLLTTSAITVGLKSNKVVSELATIGWSRKIFVEGTHKRR